MTFIDLQRLVDGFAEAGERERANYHLTLGKLIEGLAALPVDTPVRIDVSGAAPGGAHSYRGYYSDLAFEPDGDWDTVAKFLGAARVALGQVFRGYKGGEFTMHERTPLWLAPYGTEGRAIINLDMRDGVAVLVTKEIDL